MNTPARILIVEDECLVADDLEQRLNQLGYIPVGIVDTGEQAVAQALELRPDLVLMDIRLKGPLDGIEAAGQLRVPHHIPVVFLTSHADQGTLDRAGVSEPFGYLTKPFEERDLNATVEMALYRHRAEERVRRLGRWLATTLRSIGDAVIATNMTGHVTYVNPAAEVLTGWTLCEAMGLPWNEVFRVVQGPCRVRLDDLIQRVPHGGGVVNLGGDTELITRAGRSVAVDNSIAPLREEAGGVTGCVIVFRDVSERKTHEAARERLVAELQKDLASVETLSGLLPICASCKKIRNGEGCWQVLETYLSERTAARFTHGFCPECFEKQMARLGT